MYFKVTNKQRKSNGASVEKAANKYVPFLEMNPLIDGFQLIRNSSSF